MSFSLKVTWHGKVALLSFSDASRNNQLCWAAVDRLAEELQACRESGARVVVLASALDGHWLEHAWLQDLLDGLEGRQQTGSGRGWFGVQEELSHEQVVSIAAITGNASGGGAELGWACDLRIAESQAMLSQPEVDMGLTTGIGGCSRLSRLAGRAVTTDMVLTGQPVSAQRLYELGAISRIVPQGQAVDSALELAQTLAEKPPTALAGLKRILGKVNDIPLPEALRHEQTVFQEVAGSEEALAGMQARQASYDKT